MKKLLFTAICFLSISAFANKKSFDLKIDLAINGQKVSSPRLTVFEGEKGPSFKKIKMVKP